MRGSRSGFTCESLKPEACGEPGSGVRPRPRTPHFLPQCPGRGGLCLPSHTRRPSKERILSLVLEWLRWPPFALRVTSAPVTPLSSLAPARSAGAGRVSGARRPWAGRQSVVPGVSGRVRRSPALAPRLSVSRRCRLAGPAPVCRARPGRGSLTAIQHQTAQGTFKDVLLLFFHFTHFSGIASSVLKT